MSTKWDNFKELLLLNLRFKGLPNESAQIYGNQRNQIGIEISVKILDQDDKIMPLFVDDLKDLVYLCDYETGVPLTSPWYTSNDANDYTRPVITSNRTPTSTELFLNSEKKASDVAYITKYLWCSEACINKIIAVGINIPGTGNFDTSRNGTDTINTKGGKGNGSIFKSGHSLAITSLEEMVYNDTDLIFRNVSKKGRTEKTVQYVSIYFDQMRGLQTLNYNRNYNCHYDNHYVTVENGIKNAKIYEYSEDDEDRWFYGHASENNNQHIIVVHPFNTPKRTETFGFVKSKQWDGPIPGLNPIDNHTATFDLRQTVIYNEMENHLCFTHLFFQTSAAWTLPDLIGLGGYSYFTWFEFWDIYGNRGQFKLLFSNDHKSLVITRK